jgi:hypothetical protein
MPRKLLEELQWR